MSGPIRRNSSEYSSSERSFSSCIVQQNFTKDEKRKGRSKVYGLIFTDPFALGSLIPSIVTGAVPVITFFFLGNIINSLSLYSHGSESPLGDISIQCLWMLGITVIATICNILSSGLWIKIGARIATKLKHEIFGNIMKYDVAFYDTHSIGGLLTILGEDVAVIQECFGIQKGLQIQSFGQFFIGWLLTLIYSWKVGLILLCAVPVCILIMLAFHPYVEKQADLRFKEMANTITIAEETISAIRTVRGYNREEEDTARFVKRAQDAARYEKNIIIGISVMFFAVMMIVWGIVCGMLYYSSTLVGQKENGKIFDVGRMFSCFGFSMMGCMGIVQLEWTVQAENRAVVASARIIKLTSYVPSINFDGGKKYEDFKGHIQFQNVSFKYPTRSVLALKNVSFEVVPGETVALVGHSGSGKSTCVQLMERYYDVTEGIITIDGYDIKELDPRWLHRKISLVSQEPTLFEGTVRKNVLYGVEEEKSDDEVWAALEIANAKKFVTKFDKQLDQIVGDKGSTVSGGQRQRIAIARAVIKDPVILMTDEATSALDSESEKKVQNALDKILSTRTGVIVAHRLTTIKNAKRIYVFDAGEILEIGNHEELLSKGGVYFNLVKRQLQKSDIPDHLQHTIGVESINQQHEKEEQEKNDEQKEKHEDKTDEKNEEHKEDYNQAKEEKKDDEKEESSDLTDEDVSSLSSESSHSSKSSLSSDSSKK